MQDFLKTIFNALKCSPEYFADILLLKKNPAGIGHFSLNREPDSEIGEDSFAEGSYTIASGRSSHAEGAHSAATGLDSHAEGCQTEASGDSSHAEGFYTIASGNESHAEGFYTTAEGGYSHAEGLYTVASASSSHAQGKYNKIDTARKYLHIVGNGTSSQKRSNAHTLDLNGNAWFSGDVYIGSTSGTDKDSGSKKLATEEYVDTLRQNLILTDSVTGINYLITIVDGKLTLQEVE